jgi:hypothetical protein
MGFTRYWRINSTVDSVKLSAATEDMARIVMAGQALGISLAGPDGSSGTTPSLEDEVVFNGAGEASLEAFAWPPDFGDLDARGWSFDFCKTNGQPYDTVVAACLLAAKRHLAGDICLNSDVGPEDWGLDRSSTEMLWGNNLRPLGRRKSGNDANAKPRKRRHSKPQTLSRPGIRRLSLT